MKRHLLQFTSIAIALLSSVALATAAKDPSVDELLKKLPPPEKVARPVQTALAQIDPAMRDPITHQIAEAVLRRDIARALALSRTLTTHYPKSFAAANLEGALAYFAHQYASAYSSFERAVSIQPKGWFAYVGLGITAGAQDRYGRAADHFRQATKLAPRYMPAWLYLSDCAARMHNFSESAAAARQVTILAPNFYGGWWELARAEKSLGHAKEAAEAQRRERIVIAAMRSGASGPVRVVH